MLSSIGHLYLSGVWSQVDLRTDTEKDMCLKEIDYMLKIVNHSRVNSQHHSGGDPYAHLLRMRINALITTKIFI